MASQCICSCYPSQCISEIYTVLRLMFHHVSLQRATRFERPYSRMLSNTSTLLTLVKSSEFSTQYGRICPSISPSCSVHPPQRIWATSLRPILYNPDISLSSTRYVPVASPSVRNAPHDQHLLQASCRRSVHLPLQRQDVARGLFVGPFLSCGARIGTKTACSMPSLSACGLRKR